MKTFWQNEHSRLRLQKSDALPESLDRVRELIGLTTDSKFRKQGFASKLMKEVCNAADFEQIVLLLQPRSFDFKQSSKTLEKFYVKFGFIKIQNKPTLMARRPLISPVMNLARQS